MIKNGLSLIGGNLKILNCRDESGKTPKAQQEIDQLGKVPQARHVIAMDANPWWISI